MSEVVVKLPADIKAKWLEALRSGRYKQGRTYLRNADNEFCCLGVLCDIIDPTRWELLSQGKAYKWDDEVGVLPVSLREKWGMNKNISISPMEIPRTPTCAWESVSCLTECNDYARFDFNEIASIIEKDL
jgi:hypothetical protein